MQIQFSAAHVCLTTPQLVRNLGNILGSVQEELELAFEDELALDGHGALLQLL